MCSINVPAYQTNPELKFLLNAAKPHPFDWWWRICKAYHQICVRNYLPVPGTVNYFCTSHFNWQNELNMNTHYQNIYQWFWWIIKHVRIMTWNWKVKGKCSTIHEMYVVFKSMDVKLYRFSSIRMNSLVNARWGSDESAFYAVNISW